MKTKILNELVLRCEQDIPSRELDQDIHAAVNEGFDFPTRYIVPRYTSNIDDAVSLGDCLLPISHNVLSWDPSGLSAKITYWPHGLSGGYEIITEGFSTDLAMAIIIAVLKAKSEALKMENKND